MIKPVLKSALFLFLAALSFTSCRKDSSQPTWDVDILAPLIKSSLSINDLITDSLLVSNPDSSIKIVYNSDLINFSSDTLAQVPDTAVSFSFVTPIPYSYSPGDVLINKTSEIDFDLSGIELKKAIIKTEFIKLHVENRMDSTIVFEYKIPCATINSIPFSLFDSVPGGSNLTPAIYDTIIDLKGYTVDLTGLTGTKYNIVTTQVKAYISKAVDYVAVALDDSLFITNSAYSIKPGYARGYLGQTVVNVGPEQSDFTLFKNIKSGTLSLPNVNLKLDLENSIGVDARLKINKITSMNTRTGTNIDLISSAAINKSININRAVETGIAATPVIPTIQTILLNNGNSNISSLVSNMPDKIGYSMQVNINPLGNISGSNDFVFSDYGIKAKMNIEIPLSVLATSLILSDTLLLDLGSIREHEKINNGNLYLYAVNGLPFDAAIQIYLLDNTLSKTDSLLVPPNNSIASALLGTNLKVSQAVNTKLTIPVTKEKIDKLVHSKKALVVARFNTANQPNPISLYNHYKLDFKLIADINCSFSTKK